MNWMLLGPGFLAGAAAIALPVILHFMRRRPTEVQKFPSLVFLAASLHQKVRMNNIRRWLVLLARCAILALIALAFARPFLAQQFSTNSKAVMIVLDNSYSMGADGQFEKSRDAAIDAVRKLNPEDYVGFIVANSKPSLVKAPTQDKQSVSLAISDTNISNAANDYEQTIRMADAQLAKTLCGAKEINIFGDNQDLAWQKVNFDHPLSPGVTMTVEPTKPRELENVALEEVKIVTPFTQANQKLRAHVRLRNRSDTTTASRTVHLEVNGLQEAQQKVTLNPSETVERDLEFTVGALVPTSGKVALDPDVFPADDARYFALNPAPPLRVGLGASPDSTPGDIDLLAMALAPSEQLAPMMPVVVSGTADIAKCDLLVLRPGGTSDLANVQNPVSVAMLEAIRAGKPALVFADGSHASALWLEELGVKSPSRPHDSEALHLSAIDFTNPSVTVFAKPNSGDLFDIRFTSPPRLELPDDAKIIAGFSDGSPAIAEITVGTGPVVIVASGLQRHSTTWPLQSTFVPFLHETIKNLAGRTRRDDSILVGDPLPGTLIPSTAASGFAPTNSDAPGIVNVMQNNQPRLIAVNVDATESDLTPWTNQSKLDHFTNRDATATPATPTTLASIHYEETEQNQRRWWYLIAAATVLLLMEIGMANRTAL